MDTGTAISIGIAVPACIIIITVIAWLIWRVRHKRKLLVEGSPSFVAKYELEDNPLPPTDRTRGLFELEEEEIPRAELEGQGDQDAYKQKPTIEQTESPLELEDTSPSSFLPESKPSLTDIPSSLPPVKKAKIGSRQNKNVDEVLGMYKSSPSIRPMPPVLPNPKSRYEHTPSPLSSSSSTEQRLDISGGSSTQSRMMATPSPSMFPMPSTSSLNLTQQDPAKAKPSVTDHTVHTTSHVPTRAGSLQKIQLDRPINREDPHLPIQPIEKRPNISHISQYSPESVEISPPHDSQWPLRDTISSVSPLSSQQSIRQLPESTANAIRNFWKHDTINTAMGEQNADSTIFSPIPTSTLDNLPGKKSPGSGRLNRRADNQISLETLASPEQKPSTRRVISQSDQVRLRKKKSSEALFSDALVGLARKVSNHELKQKPSDEQLQSGPTRDSPNMQSRRKRSREQLLSDGLVGLARKASITETNQTVGRENLITKLARNSDGESMDDAIDKEDISYEPFAGAQKQSSQASRPTGGLHHDYVDSGDVQVMNSGMPSRLKPALERLSPALLSERKSPSGRYGSPPPRLHSHSLGRSAPISGSGLRRKGGHARKSINYTSFLDLGTDMDDDETFLVPDGNGKENGDTERAR
jgi:hypothetical protein